MVWWCHVTESLLKYWIGIFYRLQIPKIRKWKQWMCDPCCRMSVTVISEMANGSRYYRALESISIASASSSALTIYPCQIRVHQQHWQSKLQLPTARKKEWWPVTAGSSPLCGYLSTLIHTTSAGLEPTTFQLLVWCATSSATDSPHHCYSSKNIKTTMVTITDIFTVIHSPSFHLHTTKQYKMQKNHGNSQ